MSQPSNILTVMEEPAPARVAARRWTVQLLGLLLGPVLVYGVLIYRSLHSTGGGGSGWGSPWYWLYATAYYAVGFAGWLFLIYRFVCRQPLARLNRRPGSFRSDLLAGLLLLAALLVLCRAFYWVQCTIFPLESSGSVEEIHSQAAVNPWSVLMVVGPYSFLAAGMMEEFNRVFLLERAWALWPGQVSAAVMIALSTLLFGLCHCYQGLIGVVNTAFFGLLLALYYYRFGRILPMIIAHGFYSAWVTVEGMLWVVAYGQR